MLSSLEIMSYKLKDSDIRIINILIIAGWTQVFFAYHIIPLFPEIIGEENLELGSSGGNSMLMLCFVFNLVTVTAAMAMFIRDKDWWSLNLNCIFIWISIIPFISFSILTYIRVAYLIVPILLTIISFRILREIIRNNRKNLQ